MKNAVSSDYFKVLKGRRIFLELKLLLMEQEPVKSIERLDGFNLLQSISPEITLDSELRKIIQEVRGVISWFDLLYLDEPYHPWKVYWHGLTSFLNKKALGLLMDRMQATDQELNHMYKLRPQVEKAMDRLYHFKGENDYALYTLLYQYDTEVLLYMMAKANNKNIKKLISHFFTKLKDEKVLLKGRDLKKMGFPPGPVYKKIFDRLLEVRLKGAVSTKKNEVRFVKENFGDLLDAERKR
jgi:tRNA nucleotidyltransferase (CCA-adding enzyme)